MGHPFDKKIVYKVTGFPLGSSSEQTVVPSYDAAKKQLTFSYEGSPSMSSETYELRESGIFGVLLGGSPLEPAAQAFPSEIRDAVTWPNKTTLKQGGGIKIDTTMKIIGREKVKVPAGEYDALAMVETGTVTVEGGTLKVSGKAWYVEGIGAVKRTVDQTDATGQASNITIEALSIK